LILGVETCRGPFLVEDEEAAEMIEEHYRRRSIQQARRHLARAESEVEAAQRFLDPRSDSDEEMALIRAVANARTSLGDALATIQARTG
jgi:hypothetical protein